jgi:membrane-bound lytic murein transglycosylase F
MEIKPIGRMKKYLKIYAHLIAMAIVVIVVAVIPLTKRGFNVAFMEPERLLEEGEYQISPYDDIFRRVCRRHHLDWRLMSAIAYCESRFDAQARSPRGAVGIMQVMPHIAKHWDVMEQELLDPAINIDVACRLYKSMQKQLRFAKTVSEYDRAAFTVASYNCGASRVIDARNLTEYYENSKHDWTMVRDYMLLLTEEEFYNHEAVIAGRFREPHITIAYTNKVMDRYENYCKTVE